MSNETEVIFFKNEQNILAFDDKIKPNNTIIKTEVLRNILKKANTSISKSQSDIKTEPIEEIELQFVTISEESKFSKTNLKIENSDHLSDDFSDPLNVSTINTDDSVEYLADNFIDCGTCEDIVIFSNEKRNSAFKSTNVRSRVSETDKNPNDNNQHPDETHENKRRKIHKCKVCNKMFYQKGDLTVHKRIHDGEKPFKCELCDRSFTQKNNLNTHMAVHSDIRAFECDICKKTFSLKLALDRHKLIHSGEKPFKCSYCDKRFTRKDDLGRHHPTHTGVKPYECNVCQKTFIQKANLDRHRLVHTSKKPYVCDACNRTFNETVHLYQHRKIHKNLGVL